MKSAPPADTMKKEGAAHHTGPRQAFHLRVIAGRAPSFLLSSLLRPVDKSLAMAGRAPPDGLPPLREWRPTTSR